MSALDAIKKRRIADPAAIERLSQGIQAETVAALGGAPATETAAPAPAATPAPMPAAAPAPRPKAAKSGEGAPAKKVDLRTLRRTGRTFPVNTKIKPEAGERLTQLARESGRSLAEVIEAMVAKEAL